MIEAASTSESPVNFYQITRSNIPEDSHLHTRRRENLKYRPRICSLREEVSKNEAQDTEAQVEGVTTRHTGYQLVTIMAIFFFIVLFGEVRTSLLVLNEVSFDTECI
jgi:hypothetical protein